MPNIGCMVWVMATQIDQDGTEYMPPRAAASLVGVTTQTVARWAEKNRIGSITLPSGHRRYVAADVRALVEGASADVTP